MALQLLGLLIYVIFEFSDNLYARIIKNVNTLEIIMLNFGWW